MSTLPLLFLAIIALTAFPKSAQPSTQPEASSTAAPPNATQEYLDAHNKARSEVGVGPLNWSNDLAKEASLQARYRRDHQNCSFADLSNSKFGGNQLYAGGFVVTPRFAVETWVNENKFYDYANNSCVPGHRCGVYTQVVWKNSSELGCAQAGCAKIPASLTICFYSPPGNVVGEKPY